MSKTKAQLEAEIKQLREDNEALYAFLAVINTAAQSAPQSVYDDQQKWYDRQSSALIDIYCAIEPVLKREHGIDTCMRVLARNAAEPLKYRVYVPKPQGEHPYPEASPAEVAIVADASEHGTTLIVTEDGYPEVVYACGYEYAIDGIVRYCVQDPCHDGDHLDGDGNVLPMEDHGDDPDDVTWPQTQPEASRA